MLIHQGQDNAGHNARPAYRAPVLESWPIMKPAHKDSVPLDGGAHKRQCPATDNQDCASPSNAAEQMTCQAQAPQTKIEPYRQTSQIRLSNKGLAECPPSSASSRQAGKHLLFHHALHPITPDAGNAGQTGQHPYSFLFPPPPL